MRIKKQHLSEQVADQIQEMILQRQYQIDERLPSERDLATSLGVSRNVVREAIKLLQERGLVTVQSGSGVYICAHEAEMVSRSVGLYVRRQDISIAHMFEVRWILEVENARLAAHKVKSADIELLEDCLDRSEKSLSDPATFTQIDVEYHRLLAVVTGNPVLPLLLDTITDSLGAQIQMTSGLPGAQENALRHHRAIFEAVKRNQPTEAQNAMINHLKDSWDWLLKLNPDYEIGDFTFPIGTK
jgi:DNA-binding FadR family transcriptional regulator